MSLTIRAELPDDCEGIGAVHRAAFGGEEEARLVEVIRETPEFEPELSLVAEQDEQIVGHILFSPIRIEGPSGDSPAMALAPIGVVPARQRQGIGSALVHQGLDACRRLKHSIVVVLGHPEYYPRFGFVRARGHGIRPPFDANDAAFMVLALHEKVCLSAYAGIVRYPAVFGVG